MREYNLQELIRNYPNLLHRKLRSKRIGKLGDIDVCLREEILRECNGRLDVAYVTEDEVHIAELKLNVVNQDTLTQIRTYIPVLQKHYPDHSICGYLIGKTCPDRSRIERLIGEDKIKILIFGQDIPPENAIIRCRHCRAGVPADQGHCSECGGELF